MRSTDIHEKSIDAMADVRGGWVVGLVRGEFVARTVIRLSGPAIEAAARDLGLDNLQSGTLDLGHFFEKFDDNPGAYKPIAGVAVAFMKPFGDGEEPIDQGSNIIELHPPQN